MRRIRCRKCNAQISVDWPRSLVATLLAAAIPLVAFLVFVEFGLLAGGAAFALGMVLFGAFQRHVVRLIVRQLPNE